MKRKARSQSVKMLALVAGLLVGAVACRMEERPLPPAPKKDSAATSVEQGNPAANAPKPESPDSKASPSSKGALPSPVAGKPESPYGICVREVSYLPIAADAGVKWVRADFAWSIMEPIKGIWRFEPFDQFLAEAERNGIKVLPILDYSVLWAFPAWDHLDEWRTYVRTVVTRYKGRISHWEVWNEENLAFMWGLPSRAQVPPNAANYVKLLKIAHEEIKAADPNNVVVLGALARSFGETLMDWDYIGKLYCAGAKDYFDVMNIHPYRCPAAPEGAGLESDIQHLRRMMGWLGDPKKPVWITETGYPTHKAKHVGDDGGLLADTVREGLSAISPDTKVWNMAILDDQSYMRKFPLPDETVKNFSPTKEVSIVRVRLKDLASLDPKQTNALLLPPCESYPASHLGELQSYVAKGGILVLSQGLPFYYAMKKDEYGVWHRASGDPKACVNMHIGWETWWTNKGVVPEKARKCVKGAGMPDSLRIPSGEFENSLFLTAANLKEGDKMIPILLGAEGSYQAPVAAAYKFNSDLKGGAVVSTHVFDGIGFGSTLEWQAAMLARTYLTSFDCGMERVFWYSLHSGEDPYSSEDNFGILDANKSPKPAYRAYQTLTKVRPDGSVSIDRRQEGDVCVSGWRRPDGRMGWALWSLACKPVMIETDLADCKAEAFDTTGKTLPLVKEGAKTAFTISPAPTYLIGPERLGFTLRND